MNKYIPIFLTIFLLTSCSQEYTEPDYKVAIDCILQPRANIQTMQGIFEEPIINDIKQTQMPLYDSEGVLNPVTTSEYVVETCTPIENGCIVTVSKGVYKYDYTLYVRKGKIYEYSVQPHIG